MKITVTELKNNVSKYLLLSKDEDIYITKNGKIISKLSNPYKDKKIEALKSLVGMIPSDFDVDAALEERLKNL